MLPGKSLISFLNNKMLPRIAQVAVGLPVEGPFDYTLPEDMRPRAVIGQRVWVPFAGRRIGGVIMALKERSAIRTLKPVLALLDEHPALTAADLRLARRMSEYYGCSVGEALESILPAPLRRKTVLSGHVPDMAASSAKSGITLLVSADPQEIWPEVIRRIKMVLAEGRGVIALSPEAAALKTVTARLAAGTGITPVVTDKKGSARQVLAGWQELAEGRSRLAAGTRSAVFAPVRPLGLIVMFDEDHAAYKQEQSPFYHAREMALMRAQEEGADVLFVSAAPSAEIWHAAGKDADIRPSRTETFSPLQLVDLSNFRPGRRSLLALTLQNQLQQSLDKGQRCLLYLNRRGFSTSASCTSCGKPVLCERCQVSMAYLYSKNQLVCHLCGAHSPKPEKCPHCRQAYLRFTGTGIEKLESDLSRVFPQARIAVFDRDSKVLPAGRNLLIATQAVFRVLDKYRPDVIAVLDVDGELNRVDFRSGQRVFALIVRLRQAAAGRVIVQTRQPSHYTLKRAAAPDYKKFYREELKLRKELDYPPYRHLVAVMLRGPNKELVYEQTMNLFTRLKTAPPAGTSFMDPQPDHVAKLRDQFRFTIMISAGNLKKIHAFIKAALKTVKRRRDVIVTVNVDP